MIFNTHEIQFEFGQLVAQELFGILSLIESNDEFED